MLSRVRRALGHPARRRGESGAVAMFVAFTMIVMAVIGGMVLDFGLARLDRQTNKSAADRAASAGVIALGANYDSLVGACAALQFLKTNVRALANLAVSGPSCTNPVPAGCDPLNPVILEGNINGYYVKITTPYVLPANGSYGAGTYGSLGTDQGDPAKQGCDQLQVIVRQARTPGLGSLASSADLVTNVNSVARSIPQEAGLKVAVAIMLDPHACPALNAGGGGKFVVTATASGDQPGFLHSDSDGSGCASGAVLQGGSAGGIKASRATNPAQDGIIQTRATSLVKAVDSTTNVVAETVGGLSGTPTTGTLVTRAPVDERYRVGVSAAMSEFVSHPGVSTADKVACGATPPAGATAVWFNCTGGNGTWSPGNMTLADAEYVYVDADAMKISPGATVVMPKLKRLYVRGSATANAVLIQGRLVLQATPDVAGCPASPATPARVLVGTGGFKVDGVGSKFCNTTVLLLGGDQVGPMYGCVPPSDGMPPGYWALPPLCSTNLSVAVLDIKGGITWVAPNYVKTAQADDTVYESTLEDLAFWSESPGDQSFLSASSILAMQGVFFAPNAPLRFGGNANLSFTNAQFIGRILTVQSATVTVSPNIYNMIPIAASYGSMLVR